MEDRIYEYVYNHIKNLRFNKGDKYGDLVSNEDFVVRVSTFISRDLSHGFYDYMEIFLGEHDKEIEHRLFKYLVRENSTGKSDKRKHHKYKKIGVLKDKMLITLIIVASLTVLTSMGVGAVVNKIQDTKDAVAAEKIDSVVYSVVDGYEFPDIWISTNHNFPVTAKKAVEFYNNLDVEGNYAEYSEYRYLGIYEAYKSVQKDSLYIMDEMLDSIKEESKATNDRSGSLYNNICNYNCFLEFANDRLFAITGERFEGIDGIITEYLNNKNDSVNNGTPYQELDENAQKKVEKFMELYRNANEELEEEYAKSQKGGYSK